MFSDIFMLKFIFKKISIFRIHFEKADISHAIPSWVILEESNRGQYHCVNNMSIIFRYSPTLYMKTFLLKCSHVNSASNHISQMD